MRRCPTERSPRAAGALVGARPTAWVGCGGRSGRGGAGVKWLRQAGEVTVRPQLYSCIAVCSLSFRANLGHEWGPDSI